MATIADYVAAEFATFHEKPLCEVDALVFSQLAMVRMAGMVPLHEEREGWGGRVRRLLGRDGTRRGGRLGDLLRAERYGDMFTGLVPDEVKALLLDAAASPRFRDLVLHDYASAFSETERTQFAAVAFTCPGQFTYLAFRGTDRSWTGWKEDFDMAYAAPVPAQEAARRYVEAVGARTREPLVLGGHSKGGNLAVYAAAKASSRAARRITAVYDHDGPGFPEGVLAPAEVEAVRPLVRKTVPQESLVGLLMEDAFSFRVVKSAGRGIEQHSPFRWQVEDGALAEAPGLALGARFVAEVLNEWIAGMGALERRRAVDALFEALRASGAKDAGELLQGGPKALGLLVEAARKMRPEAREVIAGEMRALSERAARKLGGNVGSLFGRG